MMNLGTSVWHLLHGKPIEDKKLRTATIDALRSNPDYLKPIIEIAKSDYDEELTPKLKGYAEEYRKSPNQSGKITPKFIMLHHGAGSFWGMVSWILNPTSDVSYHYVINPDNGNRIQHVWDTWKAWHAGKTKWRGYTGLNAWSIGISFAGDTNKRTPAPHEIDSCAKKCIYLMDKFDIDIINVITHQMAAPKRKNDVSKETYGLVISRINQLLPLKQ